MNYNFDEVLDRSSTSSYKWEKSILFTNFGREDVMPFQVADMDFKSPQPVIDALVKRAEHGVFGYTIRTDTYYDVVANWFKRRHDYTIQKDWVVYTPGVLTGLTIMLQNFCQPGDKVIIQEPVYNPFRNIIVKNKMKVMSNELLYDDGQYTVDFDDFEILAKDPKTKVFILCNPHNPSGRVFTEQELKRMGEICLENDVMVFADEIHFDLVLSGNKHKIFTSLKKEFEDITILGTAPSKTFNLPGLNSANMIIPNKQIRDKFSQAAELNTVNWITAFGLEGLQAAYTYGDEWLDQMLVYLEGNIAFTEAFLQEKLPEVRLVKAQGTYLGWFDFNRYKDIDIYDSVIKKAGVAFQPGKVYGNGGDGFMRACLGCPRSYLEEALERVAKSICQV